jgi:hypothetical protein
MMDQISGVVARVFYGSLKKMLDQLSPTGSGI